MPVVNIFVFVVMFLNFTAKVTQFFRKKATRNKKASFLPITYRIQLPKRRIMPDNSHSDAVLPLPYWGLRHEGCKKKGHYPFPQHGDSIPSSNHQPTNKQHRSALPATWHRNNQVCSVFLLNSGHMTATQYQSLLHPKPAIIIFQHFFYSSPIIIKFAVQ